MPTLIITVDKECCRCSTKIQKIICWIQERCEFVIEKVAYEKDKVIVSGPFDADKLSSSLWCKAGRIIKNIEIAKPPPPPPPPPPSPEPKCKLICPYPYRFPCPQPGAWSPCSCPAPHCGCQSKPPPSPPPAPPKQPACQCPTWSSCYCGGGYPPPMPYPMVVCDDGPPYGACAVM
ncbi:hypothetical protein BAE44_0002061 [Dichanthelium oligosanthes]|uniref:HMA domain-containing protein n=1 Tax=Dichanthelium oligosanthes TaxID=888268 RepID=A0A1E5WIF5_9POAL|nr:hypothetical protein BAE44_0002061 [Dichanthelium oligosanthes]